MTETSDSEIVSTRQQRIAQLAKQMPEKGLTSLNQHLDLAWLREAYRRTRKDGAVGVDGQTAADYEKDLEGNLRSLLERAKSGTYWAPPVRRVHIPKGTGGETRPIGIPTLEDKVLQRAVVMLLEPIYEQDFYDCSYGFRPRRSAHDALDSLWKQTMWSGVSCILEVDIRKFFDTLDHAHLRAFLQQRVRDGVVLRLIGKWLNAGVMEDGAVTHPEAGSPQGGVVSPVLANVYLHYVLDRVVRAGGATSPEGPCVCGPLRRRLRGRVYRRRGRAARDGRAAEAIRQVRPDDPPGQDPAGAVPQAARASERPAAAERSGNVRLPGVHALLGAISEGELGSEAEDGGQPVHAGGQDDLPMVPAPPPRPDCRATRGTLPEASRARGVLRDHGQQPGVGPFSLRGAPASGGSGSCGDGGHGALRGTGSRQLLERYPLPYLHAVHSVCRSVANG